MRKIDSELLEAFVNNRPHIDENTSTDGKTILLYDLPIVNRNLDGKVTFSFRGQLSSIVRNRINAVLEYYNSGRISIKGTKLYWTLPSGDIHLIDQDGEYTVLDRRE